VQAVDGVKPPPNTLAKRLARAKRLREREREKAEQANIEPAPEQQAAHPWRSAGLVRLRQRDATE
jgi:hypothetical protein